MNLEIKAPLALKYTWNKLPEELEEIEQVGCIFNHYEDHGHLSVSKSLVAWDSYLAESEQAHNERISLCTNRGYLPRPSTHQYFNPILTAKYSSML